MSSAHHIAVGQSKWRLLLSIVPLLAVATPGAAQAQASTEETADLLADLERVAGEQTGILQLNQSAADGSQQSNSLTVSAVANNGAAIANSTSSHQSSDNQFPFPVSGSGQDVKMTDVANNANGIVAINQTGATQSAQSNSMAIAAASGLESAAIASVEDATGNQRPAGDHGSAIGTAFLSGSATMSSVGSGSNGIIAINQSAGIGGAQTNLLAIAAAPDGMADASVIASNGSHNRRSDFAGAVAGPLSIVDSFNNSSGLVQLNQSSGGYNEQSNILAIAIGRHADATALSDTGLSEVAPQFDGLAANSEMPQGKTGLDGSFDGFTGIGQISQASGFGNSISNRMTVTITYLPEAGL